MNIYLVVGGGEGWGGWDVYDSFVCAAESSDDAQKIHPSSKNIGRDIYWSDDKDGWQFTRRDGSTAAWSNSTWCLHYKDAKVTLLGVADDRVKRGIICSSFNPG